MSFGKFAKEHKVHVSVVTLFVAGLVSNTISTLVNVLVDPIVSVDLDQNGVPDMQRMKSLTFRVGPFVFPIGRLLAELLRAAVSLALIWLCLSRVYPLVSEN